MQRKLEQIFVSPCPIDVHLSGIFFGNMINIDTRLLKKITADQLYLVCHIVNFMNENRMCFPSNKKLSLESGFSESKILRVKNELVAKQIISVLQRFRPDGSQTSNLYKIQSEYIGVFINGKRMSDLDTSPINDEGGGVFNFEGGRASDINTLEVLTNRSINHEQVLFSKNKFFDQNEINEKTVFTKINPFTVITDLELNNQNKKEKEKSCAKKEKEKADSQPKAITKVYEAFTIFCQNFESLSGAAYPTDKNGNYIMTPKDAGQVMNLMKFIEKVDRTDNWQNALAVFVTAAWNLNDKWIRANFSVSILYSQSSKIFTGYQTSSPEAKNKNKEDEVNRLLAIREQERIDKQNERLSRTQNQY